MDEAELHHGHRTDLMAELVSGALQVMVADRGWDQVPQLWWVWLDGTGVGADPVDIADDSWGSVSPADVVDAFTLALTKARPTTLARGARPRTLYAVMIAAEVYRLVIPPDTPDHAREELMQWVQDNQIQGHPWAAEAKMVTATDLEGRFYYAECLRGDTLQDGVDVAWTSERDAGGVMTESLRSLLSAARKYLDQIPSVN